MRGASEHVKRAAAIPFCCLFLTILAVLAALSSTANAHATIVIGSLSFEPDPPGDAGSLLATIALEDPGLVEVEDAVIFLELRPVAAAGAGGAEDEQPADEAVYLSDRLEEVSPGRYQTPLPVLEKRAFTLSVRDRTYRQEEAVANVPVTLGDDPIGEITFVLPPTATGAASLGTWLIWLIVAPLVAGVLVTVMVLRGGSDRDADQDAHQDAGHDS